MNYFENITEAIGNTPLVRLGRVEKGEGIRARLLAKLEYMNPGGSVKDRPAVKMLEVAEKEALLKPGGTVVEPTSGNTGVGLALAAAIKGYRCICVMPDKTSKEKQDLLRALGAEIVVTPTGLTPDDPESYYAVADRLAREIPGGFKPGQYENPANSLSHYETTGPEIWAQTAGRITHFVAGMGTCGTITGAGRYLKEQNPDVSIVGADPEGSIFPTRTTSTPTQSRASARTSTRITTTRTWWTRSSRSQTASRS
jgi:cystathionine beta-synthase